MTGLQQAKIKCLIAAASLKVSAASGLTMPPAQLGPAYDSCSL